MADISELIKSIKDADEIEIMEFDFDPILSTLMQLEKDNLELKSRRFASDIDFNKIRVEAIQEMINAHQKKYKYKGAVTFNIFDVENYIEELKGNKLNHG